MAARLILHRPFSKDIFRLITIAATVLPTRQYSSTSVLQRCDLKQPIKTNNVCKTSVKYWYFNFTPSSKYSTDQDIELTWVDVGSTELKSMLDSGDIQLIDVREPQELIDQGIIHESAVNIPLGDVSEALTMTNDEFIATYGAPKPSVEDENVVFHCRAGVRSRTAMALANELGFKKVRHYYPGLLGWKEFQGSS